MCYVRTFGKNIGIKSTREYYYLRCPFCKSDDDKVVDSRSSDEERVVRRRRQCLACSRRFTTYERVEDIIKLTVVKKNGERAPYDRQHIVSGVQKACYKRPVPVTSIEKLAEEVEEMLLEQQSPEVSSVLIGSKTMELLRDVDKVAYVRFASVYRKFQDVGEFINEVRDVMQESDKRQGQQGLFDR